MSVRSSLFCSGEREVGDTEVNAGHRRQQTGLNWREPVSRSSPTTANPLDGGEVGEPAKSEEERGGERHCKRKTRCPRINSERRIYARVDFC